MSSKPLPPGMEKVDIAHFCRTCARFPTGVTILTVLDGQSAPHGMTASSFTSVSLDPPLVLVCVDHRATVIEHLRSCEYFAINILSEEQHTLSERFARRGEDRFDGVAWNPGYQGLPLIPGALASFECAVHRMVDAGDHAILIGEVLNAEPCEGRPLVYFGSGYHKLDGASG